MTQKRLRTTGEERSHISCILLITLTLTITMVIGEEEGR